MSILRQAALRTINKVLSVPITTTFTNCSYHILNKFGEFRQSPQNNLLSIPIININQTCGFKVKGKLRKRCKDCYFVMREQRLYVICNTHPRHKQMSVVKDKRNTWILSHATQSKVRPW